MSKSSAEAFARTKAERLALRKAEQGGPRWKCMLKAKRVELGLSVDDVAAATKLTPQTILNAQAGRDPKLSTAWRIASFFGMTVEQMWPTEVNP